MHFDPSLKIKLTVDAFSNEISVILSHVLEDNSKKQVAYASQTLTATERVYSQIDKEASTIVFGVKKFHQ